jgi:hypothetical protein
MKSLLILGCSATKRLDPGTLPAVERYDGPLYRVLRGWIRETPDHADRLDVAILSARYGLIDGCSPIEDYNQHITLGRAQRLRRDIATLTRRQWPGPYARVYISMGAEYRKALPATLPWPAAFAQGGIGTRQHDLKHWLQGL